MTKTAKDLADLFDNDGQCRRNFLSGRKMRYIAASMGAAVQYPNGRRVSPIVYVFDDGSAIVEGDDGWDFRAEGCKAHCRAGGGCRCGEPK